MPGPSTFDKKVFEAMGKVDYIPEEFKSWLPRYLRYISSLQIAKTQIPGLMGENWRNVGDAGQPAFTTPWRHYQLGVTTFGRVRFYKDYQGIVHLEGIAETTGTPTGTNIFSLPAGYRPTQSLDLSVLGYIGGFNTSVLQVTGTGDVLVVNPGYATFVVNSWISLSNIHFRAG